MILKEYFKDTLNVFLPKVCLVCGGNIKRQCFVCGKCLDFKLNSPPLCLKCGISIQQPGPKSICKRCMKKSFYFDRCHSPFLFTGPLKELIHLFKYKGYESIGKLLSEKFLKALSFSHINFYDYDLVTYVPLSKPKLRQREYNQSLSLAVGISQAFNLDLVRILSKKVYTSPQVTKNYRQRQKDLTGNFQIEQEVYGKKAILVDDVFTTGATVSECSRILKDNGAKEVLALTLAIVT